MSATTTTKSTKSRRAKTHLGGATKTVPTGEKMMTATMFDASTMTAEREFEVLDQLLDEAKLAAAVAALLEGGDDPQRSSFVLGKKQHRVLAIEGGVVSITFTCEPKKFVTLLTNVWANFIYYCEQIDDEAKKLDCKTRPVAFLAHIGDRYYVTVKEGWNCIDIRRYYVPYGLTCEHARPSSRRYQPSPRRVGTSR